MNWSSLFAHRTPNQAERLAGELAARLRQQTNLVAEVTWQPPWMEHPEQLGELLGWLWFNQPPEDFAALTNRLAPDQLKSTLEQTKEALATSMSPMDLARREFDPFDLLTMPALTNLAGISTGPKPADVRLRRWKIPVAVCESAVDLASYRSCESWLKAIHAVVDRACESGTAKRRTGKASWSVTPGGRCSWRKSPRACNTT